MRDTLVFGEAASEREHQLLAEQSEVMAGALRQTARRLLPTSPPTVDGGTLSFTLKLDPVKRNYVTIKFWGSDFGDAQGRLYLFSDKKQIGWRHLGEVDPLSIGAETPLYPERFCYTTVPLPLSLTRGKTELPFSIRSTGPIFNYGNSYAQYQKRLEHPTRSLYRLYVHTEAMFVPPAGERQGQAPRSPSVRTTPGEETLDRLKANVNDRLKALLTAGQGEDAMPWLVLARAYDIPWTSVYHIEAALHKVTAMMDDLVRRSHKNPNLVADIPKWQSFGPAGHAIFLLSPHLGPLLDAPFDAEGDPTIPQMTRRAAWAKMLRESLDYRRTHRPMYSNQAMISDLNLYTSNLGLEAIAPEQAMPEMEARRYLYEAVGIQPWLGDDSPNGPLKSMGDHYTTVTAKGLTKELGFVGLYGEVTDWVARIYEVTCRGGKEGDAKLKKQLEKMLRVRSYFRYPSLDAEGNRAMVLANIVGWRDTELPGGVLYGARTAWESSAIHAAALLRDPESVGYAQQMLADGHFFPEVLPLLSVGYNVVTFNLLTIPEDYATLQAQPASPSRLPTTPGHKDFVFADEEDGVLALKHGSDLLFVSTYWRARYAVNDLARVHYITPQHMQIATIQEETQFTPSGLTYTFPDWVDMAFGNGGFPPPGNLHQAYAREQQPIAHIPDGVKFRPGDENSYAGKADFYTCRFGNYLIGMNCTRTKSFALKIPAGVTSATDLMTGKPLKLTGDLPVKAMSTVVLYLPSH